MDFKKFQGLSDDEKVDCLWGKGSPVGSYDLRNAKFILYQVEGFYVEAEYKTDFLEIVMLKAFEVADLPLHYLEQVNISGLKI